jgi:glycosyltransferase involved in cell wall biosynthesis
MELSVIIPTLNEEKYLPKLLNSLKKQNYKDFEIIVSDGNSDDKTRQIAKNYGCRFVVNKKRHPSCQRNEGAKIAKGNIFLFLDADTGIPDDFLEKTIKEFKKRNLIGAGFYIKTKLKEKFYKKLIKILNFFFFLSQSIRPTSIGVAILCKREDHFKIGGFDETIFIGEDYDYIYKIFRKGKFKMIKKTFVYYSVRRLKKEGKWNVLWKWLKATGYVLIKGPVRKKIVDYDFGNYK